MKEVSYIIGRQIGSDFKAQNLDINFDELTEGLKSAYLGEEAKISPEKTQEIMNAFQVKMASEKQKKDAEASKVNIELGQLYLNSNKEKEGVSVTDSGLQYSIVSSGEGQTPTASSTVEVHYEGTLIDGTIFDSSYKRGQTTSFPVNGVIPGWTEALQLMKEGDVWNLTIPSELAYGERGAGAQIGPHSVLNFKVELIKVVS